MDGTFSGARLICCSCGTSDPDVSETWGCVKHEVITLCDRCWFLIDDIYWALDHMGDGGLKVTNCLAAYSIQLI